MSDAAEFLAKVRSGEIHAVQAALDADPELARLRDASGVSVVCSAVYFAREDVAPLLARSRHDLDMFEASTGGDARRVRELIASDPTLVDAYSPDGFHPLGYACFFGRREVAEVLLAAGADLEAPSRNAMNVRPLHSAVAQSDSDTALLLARCLLTAGADPNVTQQGGATPLHEAAFRGHAELVRLLLEHGADPESRDADGNRPRELAHEHGHQEVAALLSRSTSVE